MSVTLDIANELYPVSTSETFTLAVARSLIPEELDADGDAMDGLNGNGDGDAPRRVKRELWRTGDQGLAADYEYVMYGKVGHALRNVKFRWGKLTRVRYISLMIRLRGMLRRASVRSHETALTVAPRVVVGLTRSRTAYFSFGGLLMALRGSYRHLANVVVGENVYLLMRK